MNQKHLPSAEGNRSLHFKNLNRYSTDGFPAEHMWDATGALTGTYTKSS